MRGPGWLPKTSRIIRDAIIAHCEYRNGQFYATQEGCAVVQKIMDAHKIPVEVSIGDDGKFLVVVRTADLVRE